MHSCLADSMVTPRPPGCQELLLWNLVASVPLKGVPRACVDLALTHGKPTDPAHNTESSETVFLLAECA